MAEYKYPLSNEWKGARERYHTLKWRGTLDDTKF